MFAKQYCKFSLTMDKCTASTQNKSSLCIITYFVDNEWKLQKRIISFFNVYGSIGFDICNHLLNCWLGWNIDQKLIEIIVDNDKVNDDVIKHVNNRLGQSLICDGTIFMWDAARGANRYGISILYPYSYLFLRGYGLSVSVLSRYGYRYHCSKFLQYPIRIRNISILHGYIFYFNCNIYILLMTVIICWFSYD